MDLKTFDFPDTDKTNLDLLNEAKQRGFYNGHTKYNQLFSSLFYEGGRVIFKDGIDDKFKKRAWSYCRSFMSSWNPKHEEKEAICALIMSELLEPKLATK